ncbi:MAG: TIGR03905 family TSCPD domain-containing protein [Acutalibacteraceae bacterium]|nr:TIGR03905 family TSCPD domain-containing protein [Acutalibacteraceae bacterium]
MTYSYKTSGTCSVKIEFEVNDNILSNVRFYGGCNGNLKGISSLCEGMEISEVINKLDGIKCGCKSTSCPDQLAKALMKFKSEMSE